jgi:hypothetical protein
LGNYLVLWIGTRGEIINKCYVITRDGVIYRERPGIDPNTGRECKPVTPELVEKLRAYERGNRPTKIETTDSFFDPGTGRPVVWFYKNKNGEIELFNLMGFHPETGDELEPVSKEIVELWKKQHPDPQAPDARRMPEIVNPDTYPPFDPITGEARIWYHKTDRGDYAFYNRPGFHGQTGEVLLIITREVLDEWHKSQAEKEGRKCYIITRDGVRYGANPGIDPVTGRQCRPITPQVLPRLSEYEKGRRPTKIVSNEPTFFDTATGEPIVWYLKTGRGQIELFDLMGFHPQTGEELLPITKEAANEWGQQRRRCDPTSVQISHDTRLFDGAGNPLLWYWQNPKGDYEFFDCAGFHPRNGESLRPFDKETVGKYEDELRKREEQLQREQERLKKEQEEQKQKEEKEKADRQHREEQDAKRREDALRRATEAARRCDELAANPNDTRRVGEGVPFDVLKNQAREAVANCELAVSQNPSELRFKYQLGRALEWIDRRKATQIQQDLVARGYPSAFDNLGWLYFDKQKASTWPQAIALFRRGIQAGDSDAMVSLADMIDAKYAASANPREEKLNLYCRAGQLGNAKGIRACQAEMANEQVARQQQINQLEQQRLMMQFMGRIIQSIR